MRLQLETVRGMRERSMSSSSLNVSAPAFDLISNTQGINRLIISCTVWYLTSRYYLSYYFKTELVILTLFLNENLLSLMTRHQEWILLILFIIPNLSEPTSILQRSLWNQHLIYFSTFPLFRPTKNHWTMDYPGRHAFCFFHWNSIPFWSVIPQSLNFRSYLKIPLKMHTKILKRKGEKFCLIG